MWEEHPSTLSWGRGAFRRTAKGQTRTSSLGAARPLPPSADIGPGGQSVGQAAQFCLGRISDYPLNGVPAGILF